MKDTMHLAGKDLSKWGQSLAEDGLSNEEVVLYQETVKRIIVELPGLLGAEWQQLRKIAVDASDDGEQPEKVKYAFKVDQIQTDLRKLKMKLSIAYSESHSATREISEELDQQQLDL